MKLYNFGFGPYPQRLTIYLAEKGIPDVDVVTFDPPVEARENWPPPAVAALSPTGSLPIVVDDDGTAVTQSLAILEYLEDAYPYPEMRGRTAAERAHTRQILNVFDEALDAFALWGSYGSDLGGRDKGEYRHVIRIGAESYFGKLRLAERMIGETEFLASARVTIADCVAMALLQYTADFYDVPIPADCRKLTAWKARFASRPSVRACVFPPEQWRIARNLMAQTGVTFG
jgi:glutathione S-transferase